MPHVLAPAPSRNPAANSPLSPEAQLALDRYFSEEMTGCNSWLWRQGREAEFARLYALPDGALRAMGLRRDGLAAWLFRDLASR